MTEETASGLSRRKVLRKTGVGAFAFAGIPALAGASDDPEWWECTIAILDYVNSIVTLDFLGLANTDLEQLVECYPYEESDPDVIYDDYRWTAGGMTWNPHDFDPENEADSIERDEIYDAIHDLVDGDDGDCTDSTQLCSDDGGW